MNKVILNKNINERNIIMATIQEKARMIKLDRGSPANSECAKLILRIKMLCEKGDDYSLFCAEIALASLFIRALEECYSSSPQSPLATNAEVRVLVDYIDKNIASELSINQLCNYLYISRNSLYKAFHSYFDCTVNEYITRRRINKAAVLLRESGDSVTTIAESVGISNYTYFSRLFKKKMGMSPIRYRKKP